MVLDQATINERQETLRPADKIQTNVKALQAGLTTDTLT